MVYDAAAMNDLHATMMLSTDDGKFFFKSKYNQNQNTYWIMSKSMNTKPFF